MPRDSAGNYSLPAGYLAVTGQLITSQQHNPPLEDIGTAITGSLPRNGSSGMLAPLNLNGYRATNAAIASDDGDLVTLAQVMALLSTVAIVPTGALVLMTGTVVPVSYLSANGQEVSRDTYSNLWTYAQASGNLASTQAGKTDGQYGPGDGSTTFTLPNLASGSGTFVRSLAPGRTIGSSQADALKSHLHAATVQDDGHAHEADVYGGQGANVGHFSNWATLGGVAATPSTHIAKTGISVTIGSTGDTETRPVNIAYPYVIKT